MCVCACACVRVCVRVCMCEWVVGWVSVQLMSRPNNYAPGVCVSGSNRSRSQRRIFNYQRPPEAYSTLRVRSNLISNNDCTQGVCVCVCVCVCVNTCIVVFTVFVSYNICSK